jgi:hypothetical protein
MTIKPSSAATVCSPDATFRVEKGIPPGGTSCLWQTAAHVDVLCRLEFAEPVSAAELSRQGLHTPKAEAGARDPRQADR